MRRKNLGETVADSIIEYFSKLVGTSFEGRPDIIKRLKAGDMARFRREPENPHDPEAVAVDASTKDGWKHIGYIARDKNSDIAEALDMGNVADVSISDITGGGENNYGVNIKVTLKKVQKKRKGVLEVDLFGNKIYYDDPSHKYFNALGQVYLSGSKYANQLESEFPEDIIAGKIASKYGVNKQDIKDMWATKAAASNAYGTGVHAAIELYGKYKELSMKIEKDTYLHNNPVLERIVSSFYKDHATDKVGYEVLVVDHKKRRAGRIDRLERNEKGVYVTDIKTNADMTPSSLAKYWYQLSFYAAILIANGLPVEGLKIYHYNGDSWDTYEHEVIDIDKIIISNGKVFKLDPSILTHPHIPKPLHEVNPRNIMGNEEWDKTRKKAYASTDDHCIACGIHKTEAKGPKWMEAHEFYEIDYTKGEVKIKKIIPLCHYCHNFIHSGRLQMIIGKEKTKKEVVDILDHGFSILEGTGIKAFYATVNLANALGVDTRGVEPYEPQDSSIPWGRWRMVWKSKKYPPKYKTYEEWLEKYGR